jgi:XTP/dITP diphosphohydrolase
MRVVLATGNAGKLREFAAMLGPAGFEFEPQSAFGIDSPPETGTTFFDNALLKARHVATLTGLAAMADDSGLEVDALDGAPGVFSARYAGVGASDQANVQKLLEALHDVPLAQRTARFRCVIALLADPHAEPVFGVGSWSGRILLSPRGQGGFGYDPVFEPMTFESMTTGAADFMGCSAAELAPARKQAESHRALALQDLGRKLASLPIVGSEPVTRAE